MSKYTKLFQDCLEVNQPESTYRFAKNIVVTNLLGTIENEEGFTNLAVAPPYNVIGIVPCDGDNVVVFSTNNSRSEIGLINLTTASYTSIYNDSALNFSTSHPIQGEYRKDVDGDRVVAWTDNYNTLRIINIDDLTGVNDVTDLDAFQDVINPTLGPYSISNSGGSLLTGAYIPITKYSNQDGSVTNWFVHDHTFYINDDSTSVAFNDNDGAVGGTISNKVANFTLSGCDTRYDTIYIGYIRVINNIVTAYQALKRSNATTLSISITGNESTIDVTLDEVLTPTANYSTVESITQLAGQLYAAGVTVEDIPDYQRYALDININYTRSLMNVISNTNSQKDSIPPSLIPGEVYAMYIGLELNKGGWAFYHIPGRNALNDGETSTITNYGLTYNKFQIDDTSDKTGTGAATNMGFWRNLSELYSNDTTYTSIAGKDLRGLGVQHHRMPTLDHLVSTYYPSDQSVGVTKLIRLGISVGNVVIPTAIQSKIKRWKIFYAKKDSSNSLFLGSDLWQPSCSTQDDSAIRWSTGGNWSIQAEQGGTDGWKDFNLPSVDTLRGHSLDLSLNTGLTPSYATFNYSLSRNNLNTQYTGFRSSGARLTICGEDRGQVASAIIDYTTSGNTVRSGTSFIKSLSNFSYLPQNALNGKFKSQYSEACFVADINTPGTNFNSLTPIRLLTRSSGQPADSQQFRRSDGTNIGTDVAETTSYLHYYRVLSSVHTSFLQQDLVPLEGYNNPSVVPHLFSGGDGFMCYMSYLTAAPTNSNPDSTLGSPYTEGIRMWKAYIGYSRYNFNFRYQTQGDIGTYYHGKTDMRTLFSPTVTDETKGYTTLIRTDQSLNLLNYDTTMNSMNIYSTGVIFDPDTNTATSFPDTIIWSPVQNEESKEFSWRSFPSGNRYVIPKNKGNIVNIQGLNNKELLINCEDTFFRTRTDTQLNAESENVFLKSASVFDLAPEELVPTKTGSAGCQHKFSCVLTKAGYTFIDDKRGAVFLYDGDKLEEISTEGMRTFFRDFMANPTDNPFNSSGYTIGYDIRMTRLVITKKNNSTSWTISYNPLTKSWVSFHDYTPDILVNTLSGKLYSTKSNIFHLNQGGAKGTYYGTTYPSFIDQTFNPEPNTLKLAYSLNWQTEVYPNTYVNGQPDTTLDYSTTCTYLTLKSPDCCTGKVTLVPTTSIYDSYSGNIRNKNRIWYYDEIRDFSTTAGGFIQGFYSNYNIDATKLNTNLDWFDQRRFVDRFVSCRFEYDNTSNKRWLLLDTNMEFNYGQE